MARGRRRGVLGYELGLRVVAGNGCPCGSPIFCRIRALMMVLRLGLGLGVTLELGL